MLFLLVALLGWCASTTCFLVTYNATEQAEMYFQDFMRQYDKHYSNKYEMQMRFEIFKDNLKKANQLNSRNSSAVFGITKFMDLTSEEFRSMYLGLKVPDGDGHLCPIQSDGDIPKVKAPDSYDWRQHNVVTEVKNQGHCGSCWAFSSTGNMEGQYAIKHGELQEFSEQQLVDCDTISKGCSGGLPAFAFQSLMQEGGAEGEQDYPYKATETGQCKFDKSHVKAELSGCYSYDLKSQDTLKNLVYQTGPIAVALQAGFLQFYHGGIISYDQCNSGDVDHAVLLVGYGTEGGTPYWIIKNSWGKWGEEGYFRIERKEKNTCNMMNNWMASAVVA